MNIKTYRQIRAAVAMFVGMTVSVATTQGNYLLAIVGVVSGMLFLTAARAKTKIVVDERDVAIREKAAQITYAIFAPIIGLGSFVFIVMGQKLPFLFAIGQTLSYLTLLMIAIYAVSLHVLNKQFGGEEGEK